MLYVFCVLACEFNVFVCFGTVSSCSVAWIVFLIALFVCVGECACVPCIRFVCFV